MRISRVWWWSGQKSLGFVFASIVRMIPAEANVRRWSFWQAAGSAAAARDRLRIATFNINNINKRLDNLLAWLAKTSRTW